MSQRTGHRVRWGVVVASLLVWFVGLAFDVGGNAIHLILFVGIAALVYELLVEEPPPA